MRRYMLVLPLLLMLLPLVASPQQRAPFVMEHTYWLKPGKTTQFITLFKKNRLPVLQAEQKKGDILWIRMTQPLASAGNDQWDFRLTVGWRDAQSAWDSWESARGANTGNRDSQRQTIEESLSEELIIERTDVPVQESSW